MWTYNLTPDPDGDSLMHYGVKGMKWKKRIARGPNQAWTASQIALERAKRAKPGYKSTRGGRRENQVINIQRYDNTQFKKYRDKKMQNDMKRIKTQSYDNTSTKLSNRARLSAQKSMAKQQVKTKINRAKRKLNAEARAGYALKAMSAAKAARKAANKKADKAMNNFKSAVATQIKVSKQKRKNKAMAKKYRGTTQGKNNK